MHTLYANNLERSHYWHAQAPNARIGRATDVANVYFRPLNTFAVTYGMTQFPQQTTRCSCSHRQTLGVSVGARLFCWRVYRLGNVLQIRFGWLRKENEFK